MLRFEGNLAGLYFCGDLGSGQAAFIDFLVLSSAHSLFNPLLVHYNSTDRQCCSITVDWLSTVVVPCSKSCPKYKE